MTETLWSGLTLGAVYVIVALGFLVSYLPSGVINFAQGAVVAAGTYLTYQWFKDGMSTWLAIVLNLVCGVALGVFCEVVAIRPLRWGIVRKGQSSELVTTVGVSTMIIGIIGIIWGDNALSVPFHGPQSITRFVGIVTPPVAIYMVVASVVAGVGLHLLFRKTRWGQACLAVAEDRASAGLRGINVNLLSLIAFGGAGALGTVSAILIGPITYATPSVGTSLALGGFVAIAMGGNGSFLGCLGGGLAVGVVSAFATRYLGAAYSNSSILILLLIVLSVRPAGLAGVGGTRNV